MTLTPRVSVASPHLTRTPPSPRTPPISSPPLQIGATHSYFSAAADVYRWYGLFAVAKNVETFSNGIIVYTFRLRSLDLAKASAVSGFTPAPPSFAALGPIGALSALSSLDDATRAAAADGLAPPHGHSSSGDGGVPHHHHPGLSTAVGSNVDLKAVARMAAAMSELQDRRAVYSMGGPAAVPLEDRLRDLTRDIALHFCLPRTSLTPLLHQGLLSAQEVAYAYVGVSEGGGSSAVGVVAEWAGLQIRAGIF